MAALPTARSWLAAAVGADGRIYAIGGANAGGMPMLVVEAYTPSTNSWARVTSLNIPRSGLAAAEGSDGRIYAIGGKASFGVTNIVEAYSASTNRWTQVALMPTPRSRLAAAAGADGRIYAIGGANESAIPFAVVQAYTPAANTWTTADTLPVARSELAAAAGTEGHIFAMGGTRTAGALSRVESLAVSNKQGTSTAVASSANPSMSGQGVIFIATVSVTSPGAGTPTGTVQFVIDGSNADSAGSVIITNGGITATFSTSGLTVGTHTVHRHIQWRQHFFLEHRHLERRSSG